MESEFDKIGIDTLKKFLPNCEFLKSGEEMIIKRKEKEIYIKADFNMLFVFINKDNERGVDSAEWYWKEFAYIIEQELNKKVKIVSGWGDDLAWCPSQCYLKMTFEGRYFLLYLRWRHTNPWSATLIECDSDFDMYNEKCEWVRLEIDYWKDNQINEAKENAIDVAKKIIYNRIKI